MKPERFAQRFRQRVVRQYFVRFHMSLILAATTATALIASKLMLMAGLGMVLWRYPLALAAAYLAFLGLTRLWVSYVLMGKPGRGLLGVLDQISLDVPDLSLPSRGDSPSFSFGGGDSGGGGASSSWDGSGSVDISPASSGGGGGSWFPSLDLSIDLDDGIWILVALAALVAVVFGAGAYLVYAAPNILPDVALNALLASCLTGAARRAETRGWVDSVWRATRAPLLLIFLVTMGLAYAVHHTCPSATRMMEALSCPDTDK
jgi:hypothetical protein